MKQYCHENKILTFDAIIHKFNEIIEGKEEFRIFTKNKRNFSKSP